MERDGFQPGLARLRFMRLAKPPGSLAPSRRAGPWGTVPGSGGVWATAGRTRRWRRRPAVAKGPQRQWGRRPGSRGQGFHGARRLRAGRPGRFPVPHGKAPSPVTRQCPRRSRSAPCHPAARRRTARAHRPAGRGRDAPRRPPADGAPGWRAGRLGAAPAGPGPGPDRGRLSTGRPRRNPPRRSRCRRSRRRQVEAAATRRRPRRARSPPAWRRRRTARGRGAETVADASDGRLDEGLEAPFRARAAVHGGGAAGDGAVAVQRGLVAHVGWGERAGVRAVLFGRAHRQRAVVAGQREGGAECFPQPARPRLPVRRRRPPRTCRRAASAARCRASRGGVKRDRAWLSTGRPRQSC